MLRFNAERTDWPSTVIVPPVTGTKPMIALNKVDLPLPFMPTRAVIVPVGIAKLASTRAVCPFR
jgi:hypothetical protein